MVKKTYELETELTISGESEYKDACKNITKNISLVNSEMRLMTEKFSDNQQSVEALTAKQDLLKKKLKEQSEQVSVTKAMLKKLKEEGQEGSDTWKEYEIKLNNAKTAMIKTGKELDSTTKELKKAKFGWDDIGKAAGTAAKGIGIGIAAAGVAIAGLTAGLIKVSSGIKNLVLDTADWADELLEQSDATRLSAEQLQEYQYALNFIDGDLDTLTKSMIRNIRTMDDARDGNEEAAAAYQTLGVMVTDGTGKLRDSESVFWNVIDALGRIPNETERDALAMTLLGKSATDLNPIILAGSEAFKALGKEAHEAGIIMSEEDVEKMGLLKDETDRFTAKIDSLKREIGLALMPIVNDIITKANEFFRSPEGKEMLQTLKEKIGDVSTTFLNFLGSEDFKNFCSTWIPKIENFLTQAIKKIPDIAKTIAEKAPGILSDLGSIFNVLGDIIQAAKDVMEWLKADESYIANHQTYADKINRKKNSSTVQGYASGGFPSVGEIFIARENKIPEMVGAIGNQNGVVNNTQIIEGIAEGVYSAVVSALGSVNLGGGTTIIQLNGKTIAQAVNAYNQNKGAAIFGGAYGY